MLFRPYGVEISIEGVEMQPNFDLRPVPAPLISAGRITAPCDELDTDPIDVPMHEFDLPADDPDALSCLVMEPEGTAMFQLTVRKNADPFLADIDRLCLKSGFLIRPVAAQDGVGDHLPYRRPGAFPFLHAIPVSGRVIIDMLIGGRLVICRHSPLKGLPPESSERLLKEQGC